MSVMRVCVGVTEMSRILASLTTVCISSLYDSNSIIMIRRCSIVAENYSSIRTCCIDAFVVVCGFTVILLLLSMISVHNRIAIVRSTTAEHSLL
jgi:hypothetical protein